MKLSERLLDLTLGSLVSNSVECPGSKIPNGDNKGLHEFQERIAGL